MKFNKFQYFEIFSECHEVFRDFVDHCDVEMAKLNPPTAAVTWNKEANKFKILVDPEFWEKYDFMTRSFVLAHEVCHIIFNHIQRFIDHPNEERVLANKAMDVFVNHFVSENIISRELIDEELGDQLCWIDTTIKNPIDYDKNQSSEYYFNRLKKEEDNDTPESFDPFLEDILPSEAKDLIDILLKDYAHKESNEFKETLKNEITESNAGSLKLGSSFEVKTQIKKRRPWESVIKRWVQSCLDKKTVKNKRWGFPNRRFSIIQRNSNFKFPGDLRSPNPLDNKGKINLWLFLDCSGSCINLKDRFFSAACAIPSKYFNVRLFSFDVEIHELNIKEKKVKGGGGTRFDIIESFILNNGDEYPDQIFIITDGFGNKVFPKFPNRWQWFLTTNYEACIPNESQKHNLKDYA